MAAGKTAQIPSAGAIGGAGNATSVGNIERGLSVAKPDRGKKHTCHSCAAVFYDMKRTPIICPKCGAEIEVQALLKPRRPAPQAQAAKPAKPAKPEPTPADSDDETESEDSDDIDLDVEEVEEDDDDDLIEDLSDIGDDDDDMSEVKEHIVTEGDEKE